MFLSTTFYLFGAAAMIQVVSSQTVLQSYQTFKSIGCYSDNSTARALHHFVGSESINSAEWCLANCLANDGNNNGPNGYVLAGLEFGTECYCGNAILNNQKPIDPSFCNMPCTGNPSEICGGSNAINIYQNGDESFTSGPGAIVQGPFVQGVDFTWEFYGCYEDSVTNRQIPNRQSIYTERMSVETCTASCFDFYGTGQHFNVAGLQFGQECYCGDVALPPGIAAPNSSCNLQCTENANEFCGAANLNLVYYIPLLPSGCVPQCPFGFPIRGEPGQLVDTSVGGGLIYCTYGNEFAEEVCAYDEATGLLYAEFDGASECTEKVFCT